MNPNPCHFHSFHPASAECTQCGVSLCLHCQQPIDADNHFMCPNCYYDFQLKKKDYSPYGSILFTVIFLSLPFYLFFLVALPPLHKFFISIFVFAGGVIIFQNLGRIVNNLRFKHRIKHEQHYYLVHGGELPSPPKFKTLDSLFPYSVSFGSNLNCAFHENHQASTKCRTCGHLICENCTHSYTNDSNESLTLCPICFYRKKRFSSLLTSLTLMYFGAVFISFPLHFFIYMAWCFIRVVLLIFILAGGGVIAAGLYTLLSIPKRNSALKQELGTILRISTKK